MLLFTPFTHTLLYTACISAIAALSLVLWSKANKYLKSNELFLTQLQERNEELLTLNAHVTQQRDLLERYRTNVTASLTYASHLQQALLPGTDILEGSSFSHFVFYKPRDIVSGDFYFIRSIKNKLILAVIDCTGHGVPGACLSMMGYAFLNETIYRDDAKCAAQALNILRDKIKGVFKHTGTIYDHNDGMDMALCIIDKFTNKMRFAGANMNLVIVKENTEKSWEPELIKIKGNKMPVGTHPLDSNSFTNHEIQLSEGDSFYIFSDGYVSQFGGRKDRKFKTTRFLELLQFLQKWPMHKQKETLERVFNYWKGNQEQVDDVLVLGMKLKSQDDILRDLQQVLITWDSDLYSVGSPVIDYQHKQLVLLINQLYDAYMKKHELEIINTILEQLEAYIRYHFQVEENFLTKLNTDDIKSHIAEHRFFTSRISDFMLQYRTGQNNISYNLILFLKDWLINHIQYRDFSCKHLFLNLNEN